MNRILYITALAFALFACGEKQSEQTPAAPKEAESVVLNAELKEAAFTELKNWRNDNLAEAINAFALTCRRLNNEKKTYLSDAEIKVSTAAYQKICRDFFDRDIQTAEEFRRFIEQNFQPWLVIGSGSEKGKFTSYYESALNASFHKDNRYKYPVYGRPDDLIEFNIADFEPGQKPKRYVGRLEGSRLIPYYTRAEIEAGAGNAPVLLWGDDPVDIYVMQIQGSAVAELNNGQKIRVGYADNNGRPFKGIGSILLSKGLIKHGEASMGKIKQWLRKNGQKALDNMAENKRFVFHRLSGAEGPVGALGVPLTAGRSLAVDKEFIPLGALLWLETTGPDRERIEKLVIAQDIGGAIKGPVRGDYFWGSGKDEVLEDAGRMNSEGRYFIFLPRATEVKRQ